MAAYDTRQYVELFHLLFLDFLGRKLDKRYYVLKGGCNLRFFMKSFRYSEDIDIDIHGIPKEKLEDTVEGVLNSKPFSQVLRVNDMAIEKCSAPKQTDRHSQTHTPPATQRPATQCVGRDGSRGTRYRAPRRFELGQLRTPAGRTASPRTSSVGSYHPPVWRVTRQRRRHPLRQPRPAGGDDCLRVESQSPDGDCSARRSGSCSPAVAPRYSLRHGTRPR